MAKTTPHASRSARSLDEMITHWPPLSDVQREAFRSQFADARCLELGRRTASANVLEQATAFARVIDDVLHEAPTLRRYGPARFAWFLECIAALQRARAERLAEPSAPAKSIEAAVQSASKVRLHLSHVLELLVGDDTIDAAELAEAIGDGRGPEHLERSLRALAKLGEGWLRRSDAESRVLVASVDLRKGDVDQAWAAALDIERALDRTPRKAVGDRDTATVDEIEGRVVLEMRYAATAFDFAHQLDAAIPKLVPGELG